MKKSIAAVVTATTCGLMLATGATSAWSATAGGGLQAADPVLQQLESLEGQQTRAEIDAMTGTGRPVTVLVDDDGTYVSAVETAAVSPFVISPVGPGCSLTSACVKAGGISFGYKGTGTKAVRHASTTTVFAGDRSTGFWVGNSINFAKPNVTLKFTSAKTITSITRS